MPEAINCDPAAIAAASKCFCLSEKEANAAIAYLLAQIAGDTSTPSELAAKAKCYCFNERTSEAVITYLLCQIANGGSGACAEQSSAGSPVGVATPTFIGQLYHDTVADAYYRSTGLTAADWTAIGGIAGDLLWGPAPKDTFFAINSIADSFNSTINTVLNSAFSELAFTQVVSVTTHIDFNNSDLLTKLSFPALTTVGGNFIVNGCDILSTLDLSVLVSVANINATDDPALVTVNLGSLTTSSGLSGILFTNDTSLVVLSIPSLTSTVGEINLLGCTSLATVNLPSLTSTTDIGFAGCTVLTQVNIGSLISANSIDVSSCTSLTTIAFDACVTITAALYFFGASSLASISCGSWIPTNGSILRFDGCSLTASSVELILSRCVLSGVTTCTINLTGGTNAGLASLSVQGQADYATLFAAGNTITINP